MKLSAKHYAKLLYDVTKNLTKPAEMNRVVEEFVSFLVGRQERRKLASILLAFTELAEEAEGRAPIEITTARPLETAAKKTILKLMPGKSIRQETVDPTMIGGIIIRANDLLFDGSIMGQLRHLRGVMIQDK